ncbi:hypothetical protein SEA_EWALD_51 [Gordonia phage Ewald]|nr:hypothetical protein SEA_EWALD_51 [Gordonia phage Ewald]
MTDSQTDPGSRLTPYFAHAVAAAIALLAQHGIETEDARTLYTGALDALASKDPAKRAAARDLALTTIEPHEYLELSDILRKLRSAARRMGSDSGRYFQSVYALFGSDGMRLAGLDPSSGDEMSESMSSRLGVDRLLVFPNDDDSKISVKFQMWVGGATGWEEVGRASLPVDRVPLGGDQVLIAHTVARGTGPEGHDSEQRRYTVQERIWSFDPTPNECAIVVVPASDPWVRQRRYGLV